MDRFLSALARHARIYVALLLICGLLMMTAGVALTMRDQPGGGASRDPGGATPTATGTGDAPLFRPLFVHPGMTPTDDAYIHRGLVFNSLVTNPATERGNVDLVWGASPGKLEPGVYNIAYNPFSRIGNDASFQPLFSLGWFQANHPSWIEYRCDRTTPAYYEGEPNTPLDFTNPAVLQFLMDKEYVPEIQAGYQAIGFDNLDLQVNARLGPMCGHFDAQGHWVQQFTGTANDPALVAALVQWSGVIAHLIHRYKASEAVALNFAYYFRDEAASARIMQNADILTDERGFTDYGDPSYPYLTDLEWQDYTSALHQYEAAGGAVFFIDEEPSPSVTSAQMQWALANYLLLRGHNTYLAITGRQQYGYYIDHPEYHAVIGTASGDMTTDQCVYRRGFTNGLVIVNPSSDVSCPVSLPAHAYRDVDGGAVSSLRLPPHAGVVLLRA